MYVLYNNYADIVDLKILKISCAILVALVVRYHGVRLDKLTWA